MRYPVLDRLLGINTILFILPNKYISLKSKFNTPSQLWERALEKKSSRPNFGKPQNRKNRAVPILGRRKREKIDTSQLWETSPEIKRPFPKIGKRCRRKNHPVPKLGTHKQK